MTPAKSAQPPAMHRPEKSVEKPRRRSTDSTHASEWDALADAAPRPLLPLLPGWAKGFCTARIRVV